MGTKARLFGTFGCVKLNLISHITLITDKDLVQFVSNDEVDGAAFIHLLNYRDNASGFCMVNLCRLNITFI